MPHPFSKEGYRSEAENQPLTAEAVRKHLRGQQADGDTFQAVDDAELDWMAY